VSVTGFWIDSHNLTKLTGLKNALTDVLLTDADVTSITGQLYDADGTAVGDAIAFTYDQAGQWHATWTRTMTEEANYSLKVIVTAPGLTLTIKHTLPARYKGPTA